MAIKTIKQFRFYGNGIKDNQPSNISLQNLVTGSVFFNANAVGVITQLGIQALPGTRFYINNSADALIIGANGIYQLDLDGVSEITALSFDRNSINTIDRVEGAYLIVDAIYSTEE